MKAADIETARRDDKYDNRKDKKALTADFTSRPAPLTQT